MKILHTADWHLGKYLVRFSRHGEQVKVLEELCEIADEQEVDVILIAGDIFDAFNPPTESSQLFYKTIKRLSANGTRAVIVIAGNHDSPERIISPHPLAQECGIILLGHPFQEISPFKLDSGIEVTRVDKGFVELKLAKYDYPLRLILTPYANEIRLKKFLGIDDTEKELRAILQEHWNMLAKRYCDEQGVNILVSHLYFSGSKKTEYHEPDDEKPILHIGGAQVIFSRNVPSEIQYVALGHLHQYHYVSQEPCPIIYSGSPISYSFSESEQEKYVLIFDALPKTKILPRPIPITTGLPLYQKKFSSVDEAIEWLQNNQQCLVDVTITVHQGFSAEDKKSLYQSHPNIISLIPDREQDESFQSNGITINPNDNIEHLFVEFYKKRNLGVNPPEDIKILFKEIMASK